MEHYKALLTYTVSNNEVKGRLEELLVKNCFELLNNQSIYGLPLEEYRVKVQAVKAKLKQFCKEYLEENDTAYFFESRMNEERTLSAIVQSDLLKDE